MNDDTDFNHGFNEQMNPECTGSIICSKCGKFHGYCDTITQLKEKQMLPNADSSQAERPSKKSNRLHTNDLTKQPREAKILMVKSDPNGRYGAQVICKLAVNGEIKFWYLDIKKNPNYRLLVDKFGNDENDWAGQKILLGLEQDEFSDNFFVRVSFPVAEGRRK
jgi:hypothetical protein